MFFSSFLFLQIRCLYVKILKIKIPAAFIVLVCKVFSPYCALKFPKTLISEVIIVDNS